VGEIKGSAFIFRVNRLKFVGQKEWADNGILADITFLELFPAVISVHIWEIHFIIMLYDVSPTPKTIFLTARFTRLSFFHCFILTRYYIVRTVKQDLTRVITLLDFEDFLLIIATTA
jgi:hypothetical protein